MTDILIRFFRPADEFEKLEADSLRIATQQPHPKSVLAIDTANSSGAVVLRPQASQKRSISAAVDRCGPPLESSMQSQKRAKVGQPADAEATTKPFRPFFEEEWVKELMSQSEGPRPPSPVEPGFTSGLCKLSGSQEEPIVIDDTCFPLPATQPATRNPGKSVASTSAISAASGTQGRKRASSDNRNSSSDDDVPLASLNASNGAADDPTPVLAAIRKVENAVAELKKAYEDETDTMKVKLFERDFLIDKLRAQVRKRPSK